MGELLSSDGLETSGRGTGWVGPAAPPSDPVATMEAPLYAGAQPNAAGSDRTEGLDECDEWSWSVVEQRRVSYERGAAQAGVQWPVSGKLAGYDGSASVPAVNRRGTEPYARWCERTGEVTPPPTRFCPKYDQPHNPPHLKKLIFIKDWPTRTTKRASNRDTHQSPFSFRYPFHQEAAHSTSQRPDFALRRNCRPGSYSHWGNVCGYRSGL